MYVDNKYVFKYKNTDVTYDLSHLKEKMALKQYGYNGWTNYETWNVALWLGNDEDLYNLARECKTYKTLRNTIIEEYGMEQTPDGVSYNDPTLDVEELEEMMSEL